MFIYTYEHAIHNIQSRLFICFGSLLSGRQPHYIEHSIVSKSRHNMPKDNLVLLQKANLPRLNFIGDSACKEAT